MKKLLIVLLLCSPLWASIARTGNCPGAAATSCTFSATATNDVKVVVAFRSGNVTPPTLPAGWTSIVTGTGTTSSYRVGCNISSSSGDTGSGTWTNATDIAGASYSGAATSTTANCNSDAVIANSLGANTGNSASENYTATSFRQSQTSLDWSIGVGMHKTSTNCTPTGMTSVTSGGGGPAVIFNDSNATATTWAGASCAVTSGVWLTQVLEIGARTCSSTTIGSTNVSCVQSTLLDSTGTIQCSSGGSAWNGVLTVANANDGVYLWLDFPSGSIGTLTVTGNLGTGTWSAIPNQGKTVWLGSTATDARYWAIATSTGALNVTLTCSGLGSPIGIEVAAAEYHSSVGTPAIDCGSALNVWTSGSGTSYANTCTSTHTNDAAVMTSNWGGNPLTPNTTYTVIAEEGFEWLDAYKGIAASGSQTATWTTGGAGDAITSLFLITDGAAAGGPPANQFPRAQ